SRSSDLIDVVRSMESQRRDLQDRLGQLRFELSELERSAAEDTGVSTSFSEKLDHVRQAAGLSAVKGPGVEVVLGDGTQVAPGADPNDYLIHDTDISAVVNALFLGGAEAVEVNGERLVATTPIRCAGTTILVNSTRLGNPYVVRAIGDPAALEAAVLEDDAASLIFTVYASQFGLHVSIAHMEEITVAAFRGSMRPLHIRSESGGG
ncbi:MAG TPA: DUF881 domain-containing protein, partial [Coriobacteriia bacterium]|nr:DUF881 domain-containing protein [Coriobacteriia bacterium]